MSARRVVEVAREQANLLPERSSTYRGDAVVVLMNVIKEQDERTGSQRRKQRVLKIVSDLGTTTLADGADV